MKPADYNAYTSFVAYLVLGDMGQADAIYRRHRSSIQRFSRVLLARFGPPEGTIYRGLLIDGDADLDRKIDPAQAGTTFSSWSESLDVACWFCDPKAVVSSLLAARMRDPKGYVLRLDSVPPSEVLWSWRWAEGYPGPDGRPAGLLRVIGPSVAQLAAAAAANMGSMIDPAGALWQIRHNLATQQEVVLRAGGKVRSSLIPREQAGCPPPGDLGLERKLSPIPSSRPNPEIPSDVFFLDWSAPMGPQAILLMRLYRQGKVSLGGVWGEYQIMQSLEPEDAAVQTLGRVLDRETGRAAFFDQVRGAKAVRIGTEDGGEVMIHRAVRPDAPPGSYQVTRFGKVNDELLPFGHHYEESLEGAASEVWNANYYKGFVPPVIERRNPQGSMDERVQSLRRAVSGGDTEAASELILLSIRNGLMGNQWVREQRIEWLRFLGSMGWGGFKDAMELAGSAARKPSYFGAGSGIVGRGILAGAGVAAARQVAHLLPEGAEFYEKQIRSIVDGKGYELSRLGDGWPWYRDSSPSVLMAVVAVNNSLYGLSYSSHSERSAEAIWEAAQALGWSYWIEEHGSFDALRDHLRRAWEASSLNSYAGFLVRPKFKQSDQYGTTVPAKYMRRANAKIREEVLASALLNVAAAFVDTPLGNRLPNPMLPSAGGPDPIGSFPPVAHDWQALTTGAEPLVYDPGQRLTHVTPEAMPRYQSAVETVYRMIGAPDPRFGGLADPNAWETFLAQTRAVGAIPFVVDRTGGRWELIEVSFDPGGMTGELVLRHQGPLARHGDRRLDIHQSFGKVFPLMVFKQLRGAGGALPGAPKLPPPPRAPRLGLGNPLTSLA